MLSRLPLDPYAPPSQPNSIMTRGEATRYQQTLDPKSVLYSELAQKLITHESGIVQLSNGLKIDATKVRVLGGGGADILGGTLIRALLDAKEESVRQVAKNIWMQIFFKEPSANEQENRVTIAEFSAKLALVDSDEKAMLQILMNGLNEDLTKA